MNYVRPKPMKNWKIDEPGKELYEVSILDNQTVLAAYGRYAMGSGGKTVSWADFLEGEMNDLVREKMGYEVLSEVLRDLQKIKMKTKKSWWKFW